MDMTKLPDNFIAKISIAGGCWLWTGCKNEGGYGYYHHGKRKSVRAHRFAFELANGPVPAGLQIDHLCRNRSCVNPAHLEAVTARVNTLRSTGQPALNAAKSACHRGHPFDTKNTYVGTDGARRCRECHRLRGVAKRQKGRRGAIAA